MDLREVVLAPETPVTHAFLATGGQTYIRDGAAKSPGAIRTVRATAGSCPMDACCSP